MSITIKDIAKKAKVSPALVSFVINDKYPNRIAETTRKRILKIVKDLNYRRSFGAHTLPKGRTNTIGILYESDISSLMTDPYCSGIFSGLIKYASLNDLTIIIKTNETNSTKPPEFIEKIYADGIIYLNPKTNIYIEYLNQYNIPYMVIDSYFEIKKAVQVNSDNYYGGRLAAEHFLSKGHKKVYLISGISSPLKKLSLSYQSRIQGFIDYYKEHNIKIPKKYIIIKNFTYSKYDSSIHWPASSYGYHIARDIIKSNDNKHIAIFTCTDMIAFGILKYLYEKKLRVPEDVSIIGYDNIIYGHLHPYQLTSIDVKMEMTGMTAIAKLTKIINGENNLKKRTVLIKPELIDRNSVLSL